MSDHQDDNDHQEIHDDVCKPLAKKCRLSDSEMEEIIMNSSQIKFHTITTEIAKINSSLGKK